MEHSVYYNKSVDDVIQQYFRKLRIRILLGMLLVCVDAIVFYCLMEMVDYFLWGILILSIYGLSLFLLLIGIKLYNFKSFTSLSKILYYDCDPVKYEDVLIQLLSFDKRGKARATISLELAAAVLARKNPEKGIKYLQQVSFKKFALYRELRKLGCYAAYYDLQDDFVGLHKIQEELKRLNADLKTDSYFYRRIKYQIGLVEAMAAREDESIEGQVQRWTRFYSMAETPLHENVFLMRLAKLELAQGKRELSMRHMGFVAIEGNTLPCASEAIQILSRCGSAGDSRILDK